MTAEELESLNGDFQLLMDFFILHDIVFDIKPIRREEFFSSVSVVWGAENVGIYKDRDASFRNNLKRISMYDMNKYRVYSSLKEFSKVLSVLNIPLSDCPLHLLSEDILIRLIVSKRIEVCL